MIDRAIKAINPNAQFTYIEEDINSIQWLNGTTPISVSDIQNKIAELPTDEELKQDAIDKRASAKNKLKALGLTDAEIEAL
jgi:hypothetical protein